MVCLHTIVRGNCGRHSVFMWRKVNIRRETRMHQGQGVVAIEQCFFFIAYMGVEFVEPVLILTELQENLLEI